MRLSGSPDSLPTQSPLFCRRIFELLGVSLNHKTNYAPLAMLK